MAEDSATEIPRWVVWWDRTVISAVVVGGAAAMLVLVVGYGFVSREIAEHYIGLSSPWWAWSALLVLLMVALVGVMSINHLAKQERRKNQ